MICKEIVELYIAQISLLKQKLKRLDFLYPFFDYQRSRIYRERVFFAEIYNIMQIM